MNLIMKSFKTSESYYKDCIARFNKQIYQGCIVGSDYWEDGKRVTKYFDKALSKSLEDKLEYYEGKLQSLYDGYPECLI